MLAIVVMMLTLVLMMLILVVMILTLVVNDYWSYRTLKMPI